MILQDCDEFFVRRLAERVVGDLDLNVISFSFAVFKQYNVSGDDPLSPVVRTASYQIGLSREKDRLDFEPVFAISCFGEACL